MSFLRRWQMRSQSNDLKNLEIQVIDVGDSLVDELFVAARLDTDPSALYRRAAYKIISLSKELQYTYNAGYEAGRSESESPNKP